MIIANGDHRSIQLTKKGGTVLFGIEETSYFNGIIFPFYNFIVGILSKTNFYCKQRKKKCQAKIEM
ncbi:MAG TPA: hypothetical protein DD723_10100, partial [Candidatus Omnitrophica bacterium]|nr:hypothetical protein [Candidatus Omnitrophota bacterium]